MVRCLPAGTLGLSRLLLQGSRSMAPKHPTTASRKYPGVLCSSLFALMNFSCLLLPLGTILAIAALTFDLSASERLCCSKFASTCCQKISLSGLVGFSEMLPKYPSVFVITLLFTRSEWHRWQYKEFPRFPVRFFQLAYGRVVRYKFVPYNCKR